MGKISWHAVSLAAQGIGAVAVLVGVSMWSVPAAFVVGGVAVVFAVERQE